MKTKKRFLAFLSMVMIMAMALASPVAAVSEAVAVDDEVIAAAAYQKHVQGYSPVFDGNCIVYPATKAANGDITYVRGTYDYIPTGENPIYGSAKGSLKKCKAYTGAHTGYWIEIVYSSPTNCSSLRYTDDLGTSVSLTKGIKATKTFYIPKFSGTYEGKLVNTYSGSTYENYIIIER